MLFNSYAFVFLVLLTFGVYYLPILHRLQVHTLILASTFFYAYGQPALLALLLASITITSFSSYYVIHAQSLIRKRCWAILGVGTNLLILFIFKYGPLAIATLGLVDSVPNSIGHLFVTLPLPIGISFYTFQGISLVVDVFRQKEGEPGLIEPRGIRKHLIDTTFFTAFFPQLVAGPIVKAHEFYPQIGPKSVRKIAWDRVFSALVVGYFLKMVVADQLKDLTFWLTYPYFLNSSTPTLLALLFGYSMQIFADFAGYSLIAIGTARLFGYELIENFHFPYISRSLSEFWGRWHISLSSWLREYLYIPLGGNRKGPLRTYVNLMLVMTLGGLWHGAAWSYALWGVFHGLGLVMERLIVGKRKAYPPSFPFLRAAGVFVFVTVGWLFFKLPEFDHVAIFLRTLIMNYGSPDDTRCIALILFYSAPVILYHLWYLRDQSEKAPLPVGLRPLAYGICLFALLVNSGSPASFIYFQF